MTLKSDLLLRHGWEDVLAAVWSKQMKFISEIYRGEIESCHIALVPVSGDTGKTDADLVNLVTIKTSHTKLGF